jgi:hypothetical protein
LAIHVANPLTDRRWAHFASSHARASAFHQPGWLTALVRTYGYKPLFLTTTPDGERLRNGVLFCRIKSWITGTRLVSLPFADHCEPLLEHPGDLPEFLLWLRDECQRKRWGYVELRPLSENQVSAGGGLRTSAEYCFHELDLSPSLERLFGNLHKDSVQRRIRHAQKQALSYEVGRSEDLVNKFYRLMLMTRRRHQLLPQPRSWFKNLAQCMGDNLEIRIASQREVPIAAMLSLRHGGTAIYKYGCSDSRLHNLGGMPFLFWRLIEESKAAGAEKLDFGRSDLDQESLITFKDKFGTVRQRITYYRYTRVKMGKTAAATWGSPTFRQVFSLLPDSVCHTAGRLLYRHMG